MTDDKGSTDKVSYSFTYSLDRSGYFRHSCRSCGRDFKTKAEAGDIASAIQPAFRRQGLEVGENRTSTDTAVSQEAARELHCPYCNHKSDSSEMLTDEFKAYLERYMMREVLLPKIDKMFSEVEDSFGRQGRPSGGLLSVQVTFNYDRSILPPRPISGPEAPDMIAVDLLCCRKNIRILDTWRDTIFCPYCGRVLALQ